MIKFRQKTFTEYDAMKSLYEELMRRTRDDRKKFRVIDKSSLVPILRGNNIVIERFVISTRLFGKDVFRMYLKIGAKAKLPDEVRLPGRPYDVRLLNASFNVNGSIPQINKPGNKDFNTFLSDDWIKNSNYESKPKETNHSEIERIKLFGKGGGAPPLSAGNVYLNSANIEYTITELLGDAVKYDKKSRSLVLEFNTISDAINALNILPFGLNYTIYLLDA